MKEIDIGKDFSVTPMGRYHPSDGPNTGERFRNEYLLPALRGGEKVSVRIDQVEGYGSSFLEESFGGLVRVCGFNATDLKKNLTIISQDPDYNIYIDIIWRYIDRAKPK